MLDDDHSNDCRHTVAGDRLVRLGNRRTASDSHGDIDIRQYGHLTVINKFVSCHGCLRDLNPGDRDREHKL